LRVQPSCVAIMDALKAGSDNTNPGGGKVYAKPGRVSL
jgi:hypothetical protein